MQHTQTPGPPIAIVAAPGSHAARRTAHACELAGKPTIVPLTRLLDGRARLRDYRMLVLPAGASWGDTLAPGRVLGAALERGLGEELARFVERGCPVLGIGDGFLALLGCQLLPGHDIDRERRTRPTASCDVPAAPRCGWESFVVDRSSPCVFTQGLSERVVLPVGYPARRFRALVGAPRDALAEGHQVVLRRIAEQATEGAGDEGDGVNEGEDTAGVCSPDGRVFGLLPRAELALPRPGGDPTTLVDRVAGLAIFRNGVRAAAEV